MKLHFSCIVTAFALSSSFTLFSQNQPSVIKIYGGAQIDRANDITATSDGGYLLGGRTQSFGSGSADVYLIKTDSAGDLTWSYTYGNANSEECLAVLEAEPGNYLIAGRFQNSVDLSTRAFIFKIDEGGDTLWTRVLGSTDPNPRVYIVRTPDNGCILTYSYFNSGYYSSVIRFAPNGNVVWNKTIIDPAPYPAVSANDNEILILYGGKNIIRMDMNGNVINAHKVFSNPSFAFRQPVIRHTPDGGYIIYGRFTDYNNLYFDSRLIKVDSNDVVEWYYGMPGSMPPYTNSLAFDVMAVNDSCYVMLGALKGLSGSFGPEMAYINHSGQVLWCKRLAGFADENSLYHLVQQLNGNIAFNNALQDAGIVITELNAFPFCQSLDCLSEFFFNDTSYVLQTLPLALPDDNIAVMHYPFNIDIGVPTQLISSCDVTSLAPEDHNEFTVYPNPGHGVYHISVPENITQADIRIRNLSGQEIMHLTAWAHGQPVYLDAAPGMYFVEISAEDKLYTGKIIHTK